MSDPHSLTPPNEDRRLDWPLIAAGLIVLVGIALRIRAFTANPGMYIDEEMLAINIGLRSFSGLWRTLELGQDAPPLYLVTARATGLVLGFRQLPLRLPAVVAGCLTLPLMWLVAKRLLPRPASALALLLFALAPVAIIYANFVKPYGSDALVTTALVILGLRAADLPRPRGALLLLGGAGLIALPASSPSVFILAAIGSGLLGLAWKRRDARLGRAVAVIGAAWGLVLAALFRTVHADVVDRASATARYMRAFWGSNYLDFGSTMWVRLAELAGETINETFLRYRLPIVVGLVLAGLGLLGLRTCWRRSGWFGVWLVAGPWLLLLFAAAIERYPISQRTALFAAPLSAIALAGGVDLILRRLPAIVRVAGYTAALGVPLITVPGLWVVPPVMAETRTQELIEYLGSNAGAGSRLYVVPRAIPAFVFHTTDWLQVDTAAVGRVIHAVDLTGPAPLFRGSWLQLGPPADVPDEALELRWNGRVVMVGRSSGAWRKLQPDPQWAAREAARLLPIDRSCTQVLMVDEYQTELKALLAEVGAAGGFVEDLHAGGGSRCFRICRSAR